MRFTVMDFLFPKKRESFKKLDPLNLFQYSNTLFSTLIVPNILITLFQRRCKGCDITMTLFQR